MSRSVPWRRSCSETVSERIGQALQSTVYIVHQTGPTGFVLKQDGEDKKLKVFLGDPHTCTCSVFKKEKELCIHILWLLLKKFRIPKTHTVVFQLGLVEREIREILHGYLTRQDRTIVIKTSLSGSCDQRPISLDDVCPICQNDLLGSRPQRLSYCKYGCGKSVHLKCIKMWADHQKSQGEALISCPLCRDKFSTFEELRSELHSKSQTCAAAATATQGVKEPLHYGQCCSQCQVCPIAGKCYKCTFCSDFYLCHLCFSDGHHSIHPFQFQQQPGHPWRPAICRERAVEMTHLPSVLPQSIVNDLQTRELDENDYDLLLRLDSDTNTPQYPSVAGVVQMRGSLSRFQNSLRTEPLDHDNPLLMSGAICHICSENFRRGDWVRKLPCKHKFHRSCIDSLLINQEGQSSTCPIDGKIIYDSSSLQNNHRRRRSQSNSTCSGGTLRMGHLYSNQDSSPPAGSNQLSISVSGHSLGGSNCSKRTHPAIAHARQSMSALRRGSARQNGRNTAGPSSGSSNNTPAYISLLVTPLTHSTRSPTIIHSLSRQSTVSRRNDSERRGSRQSATHHAGAINDSSTIANSRKLPQITSRVTNAEIHSVLQVSSLSTNLPPIITNNVKT